jgi:RimJ/RimL family protein N-acetyltransferase
MAAIRTERLELVPMTVGDAAAIVNGRAPSPGRTFAPGYPDEGTLVRAGMVLAAAREGWDPGPFRVYEILCREHGTVIGSCGFHSPPNDEGLVRVGCSLAESARGQRYGGEALGALVGFARSCASVRRMVAEVTRANVAGQKALERAGLRLQRAEGQLLYYAA